MIRRFTILLFLLAFSLPGLVSAEQEYWEYTFRPGDSIWKIAEEYTTSVNNWAEIQAINEIKEGPDRKIIPGTRIQIPVSMLKQQPTPAIVIAVSGDVVLMRANGDKAEVKVGTKLFSGDRVVTAGRQSLRMQFADKSELQVLSNSEVVLDKLSHHKYTGMVDTRIRLNSGSVKTWVEKLKPKSRYEIQTPAAITAVRGTSFRLSSDDAGKISRTEVTEGIVAVSAGDASKQVNDGFGLVAEKGKPLPEPVKLLPAPEIGDILLDNQARIKLSWNKLDGASLYRYQLASDKKFDQVIIDSSTQGNNIELDDLQPGRYYFRIRGVDKFKLQGLDSMRDFDIEQMAEDDSSWKVIIPAGILMLVL
jgi:hypothetical protein